MNEPKISVIAVNWWAKDFAELLVGSVRKNCKNDNIEILLIDNSGELEIENATIIKPQNNLGHGKGLDEAVKIARGEYILVLDIDSHILLKDFDEKLIAELERTKTSMICAQGNQLKPIRPLFMFFKKETIKGMSFRAVEYQGVKFDVSIHLYFRVLTRHGQNSVLMLPWRKTEYENVFGDEYDFKGERMVYHNWYGTRWFNKDGVAVHSQIDDRNYEEFLISKDNLFKQV